MSVWLTIPSARPAEQAIPLLTLWRERGYRISVWRDQADEVSRWADAAICAPKRPVPPGCSVYPGYSVTSNMLVYLAGLRHHRKHPADWCVCGGDDVEPDLAHTAEEIAAECAAHFRGTFGVMQPTGDRWAQGHIDRIAGSPWIGSEFAHRAYGGNGPYWHEYRHMFADEELFEVAHKLGVYWARPDLIHLHRHWTRDGAIANWTKVMPEFLREANSKEHWAKYKALFNARKVAGFPGHELLAEEQR